MLKKFLQKLHRDDRGVTLVELIVSILILALIFTPVVSMFGNALNTNRAANNRFYAESAAKNLLEVVKYNVSNGVQVNEIDFSGLVSTPPTVNVASGAAFSTIFTMADDGAGGDSIYDIMSNNNSVRMIQSCVYNLTGYEEGTEAYDIEIDVAKYQQKNNAEFVDMSAFDDTTTALINPSAIVGGYDASVVEYYTALHRAYYNSLFQDELGRIDAHNNAILFAYDQACSLADMQHQPRPPYPETDPLGNDPDKLWPIPDAIAPKSEAEIANHLQKRMKVSIKAIEYDAAHNPINFQLDSKMEYTFTNSVDPVNGHMLIADGVDTTMECEGYCTAAYYRDLSNLYIMYTPRGNVPGITQVSLAGESLEITSDVDSVSKEINIFVVVQIENGKVLAPGSVLPVKVDGRGGKVNLYSQVDISRSGNYSSYVGARRTLINKTTTADRMFGVQIKVKDSAGEEVTTLSSTITVE